MKRVTKKAVATVLTSAMIFTTLLPGNVEPLSAFGSTSEELSVEQLTDFDYDDADLTSDGYFFMKGGKFEYDGKRDTGSELAEDAVLVTVDSDGNKTEIPSSTAEGRKFTKVVKTYTDGYYNMVVLVNGDERTLVHTNGKYFGGTEQYYDFAFPVSNNMAVVGTDTGETEKVYGKDCPVYELKLIAENGQEFAVGKRTVEGLWNDAKSKGEVGNKEIASVNGSIYVYDTQENTVECFADSTVDISGDYYMIANGTTAALYDKTGSKVMDISGGYRYIKEQKLDTDGYMIVDTASYYTAKQNIISKDGTPWNTTEWENVSKVTMSVLDAGEQTYLLHYEDKKYNKYDYIYDKDGNCLLDIKNEIKTIGKQKGYKEIEGACYVAGNNGVYVEKGEIRYYENGKVNKAYTGMATDSKTGKRYWFDNGVVARDKQVYSPADDAWYWFDADGTMAVGKDVFVPKSNDDRSQGKWVRYDENGHMVKGEDYANGGWYRFDETTGEMAKGFYTVQDGDNTKLYYYNEDTGIMEHGAVNIDGTEYAFDDVTGVAVNNSWYSIDNAPYWYENGVRQGMEGRGKEIYDPASDGWYWLDAVDGGKKAVSKDVYQESYAGAYADREDGTGKWVRYDENGRMIKGWSQQNGNTYYFDLETGAMAKGSAVIDGAEHYFNMATGVQER